MENNKEIYIIVDRYEGSSLSWDEHICYVYQNKEDAIKKLEELNKDFDEDDYEDFYPRQYYGIVKEDLL